jgi:hypothetical protein
MNQRRHPRKLYFARITLKYVDELGTEIEVPGMIEDRSESGFGIRINRWIDPGRSVTVKQGSRLQTGIVRRCSASRFDFFIGIEIQTHPSGSDLPNASSTLRSP